jgi:nucleolin
MTDYSEAPANNWSPKDSGYDSKPAGESRRGGAENNQVFVGSLSYDSNEEDLRQFFADCGRVVDVRIPVFADSGRPRGIAFVEFESDEAANKACEKDGMDLQGRQLKINIANARGGAGGGGAPRGARPDGCKTVFVGNLSWNADEPSLQQAFEKCGPVTSVRIITDRDTGRSRGFGYVEFETAEAVDAALDLSGVDIAGRNMRVDYASDRGAGGGGGRGRGRDDYGGGRGRDSEYHDRDYGGRGRDYDSYGGGRDRDYPRDRERDYNRGSGRDYDRGGSSRDYDRGSGRDYDRSSGGGRDYDRSSGGGRDYDRGSGRDYDRGSTRDYGRDRGYDRRDRY